MDDCLIVGAGAVGLSLAWELAGRGQRVRVVDRGEVGREASWAGAGILPPAIEGGGPEFDALVDLSLALHQRWTGELREATGIDNGFRRSGAIYLASGERETDELETTFAAWRARGIECRRLSSPQAAEFEPALSVQSLAGDKTTAYAVRAEAQIRNPRHLQALLAACRQRGVTIDSHLEVCDFRLAAGRVTAVCTPRGDLAAGQFCITGGAWSADLCQLLGARLLLRPLRGQIVLFRSDAPGLRRIVNHGKCYLVPRDDGRVLVGSTEEFVGFDKRTTTEAREQLVRFALARVPCLASAAVEQNWAGLRPATADGLPYFDRLPHAENAFVAAGHFRNGLTLSPGTARVMAQWIVGQRPEIDLHPFRISRGE